MFARSTHRLFGWLIVGALSASGCGGETDPTPDGGDPTDAGSGSDSAIDAPPTDTEAPAVVSTTPIDGAVDVLPDATLRVLFSEPMDESSGALALASAAGPVALATAVWNADGTELSVTSESPMPAGGMMLTVGTDFTDLAGNPLEAAVGVGFTVADIDAPTIVSTTPVEGATVSVGTSEITFTLSEEVRGDAPTLSITGPATPALGTAVWTSARTLTVPVSGLVEGDYRVVLSNVRDIAGNTLDASALGAEGALDFHADDDVVPFVVDSDPAEGQVDVSSSVVTQVAVLFSEPMDEGAGTATLTAGGTTVVLTGTWDMGGTRLLLDVSDDLQNIAAHRIALDGYRDNAGNAFDGTVYLLDGALDFMTGDLYSPYVVSATPAEGALYVPANTAELSITFSEEMNVSSADVTVVGDGGSVVLTGTWSMAGTTLTIPLGARLNAGERYTIDLTAFRDATGTLLDAAHSYLVDGVLEFTYATPRGERCGDALTQAEAIAVSGGFEWVIAARGVTADDGAISCTPMARTRPDGVIRYRKTTPAASAGGTYLHVGAIDSRGSFEILQGVCDPTSSSADAARRRCMYDAPNPAAVASLNDTWLDVGPGDYYVWFANFDPFLATTVRIEETAVAADGESCFNPYDATSAATIYTAPATPDGDHVWTIPVSTITGIDRTLTPTGPGPFTCAPMDHNGRDTVIALEKTSDTSLLTIDVVLANDRAGMRGPTYTNVEVVRGCDPTATGRSVEVCAPHVVAGTSRTFTIEGAAGPLHTWIASPFQQRSGGFAIIPPEFQVLPGITVRASEFTPGAGDTCANAIRVNAGVNPITPAGTHRAYAPSCMGSGGITWYRYTATQNFSIVRTDVAAAGALVTAAGAELGCEANIAGTAASGIAARVAVGSDVCIAVTSAAGATSLTIEEIDFDGVGGIATDLAVTTPATVPTNFPGLYNSRWMVATPTHLVAALQTNYLASVPRAGGAQHAITQAVLTPRSFGFGALADGSSIVSTISSTIATEARIAAVADAAGAAVTPAYLDMPPATTGYVTRAMTPVIRDGASYIFATARNFATTGTAFYEMPATGGAATLLGENTMLEGVGGLAADATYFYVTSEAGAATTRGVYRVRRDMISATPELVVLAPVEFSPGAIVRDVANDALYFRTNQALTTALCDLWVVLDPDAATGPRFAGRLWRAPGGNPSGAAVMAFDPSGPSLYVIDASLDTTARWYRID